MKPRKTQLVLRCHRSPGDIVVLTGVVRDLHAAYGDRLRLYLDSSCRELWKYNPRARILKSPLDYPKTARVIRAERPPIAAPNPPHYIAALLDHVGRELGLSVPPTALRGDLHLSAAERKFPRMLTGRGLNPAKPFWVLVAGGKYDITTKWWNPASWQAVVDALRGEVTFVQCGAKGHFHPPLKGVINLVGQTNLRQFLRVLYHAEGVVCPVTFAMHAAAALPQKQGHPRACVVIAGGRESPSWERYPGHVFLDTIGKMDCCAESGCWKSKVVSDAVGDKHACVHPVPVASGESIAGCMDMITPDAVVNAVRNHTKRV